MAKSETRFGTFEELMDGVPDNLVALARTLREIINQIHPETVEVVRLGDNAATYGVGPRKIKEGYCYIMPHKKWVNLGFLQGGLLEDPEGLLEGTGKKLRHIKVKSAEIAANPAIRTLISQAVAERTAANQA